ncbi:MAG: sulfatase-like hydrolase/transferase [Novipirellula sp. JB048]
MIRHDLWFASLFLFSISLWGSLWSCGAALGSEAATPSTAASTQPNVIFILCDDWGWGDLGVFHQNESTHAKRLSTPQLDQMAAEGIQLRQHYCPAPVCAPSRASLLSGVHQGHAEVRDNQFDKRLADNHTLGTVMQRAGYRTALIGKYGLQGQGDSPQTWPAYPSKRGFDEFFGYVRHRDGHLHYPADVWPLGGSELHRQPKQLWHNDREVSAGLSKCYTTDLFTARSKHWITEHTRANPQEPFFLYLAYDTPHAALQIPTMAYPEGGGLEGGIQWIGQAGRMINTAQGEIDSYRHPDVVGKGWSDVEERFATMTRRIDDCVGDLLQTLRELKIDKQTLVIFSSDNGPHRESYLAGAPYHPTSFQSYGPFDGLKRDVWEGGIRVATLAWWPGQIPPGQLDTSPSQFHDWMPTLAELAGIAPPARTDGVSLRPRLTGSGDARPSQIYVEYAQGGSTPKYDDFSPSHRGQKRGQMQVVHLDGFKGVRVDIKSHEDPFQIFDLNQDPQEQHDLANTSPQFKKLEKRMRDHVLRSRMPNASAKRPYDQVAIPAVQVAELRPGLHWSFYPGDFPYVPQTSDRTPQQTGTSAAVEATELDTAGAIQWTGWLHVPETGTYEMSLATSSRAFLRIHRAAALDADFGYQAGQPRTVSIRLAKGHHPIELTCLTDGKRAPTVDWRWGRGGDALTPLDAQVLFTKP